MQQTVSMWEVCREGRGIQTFKYCLHFLIKCERNFLKTSEESLKVLAAVMLLWLDADLIINTQRCPWVYSSMVLLQQSIKINNMMYLKKVRWISVVSFTTNLSSCTQFFQNILPLLYHEWCSGGAVLKMAHRHQFGLSHNSCVNTLSSTHPSSVHPSIYHVFLLVISYFNIKMTKSISFEVCVDC